MIIETKPSDISVIGETKEIKTTIDPRNLEYLTTLLSSNLYSNPESSFLREIVSNAWDSHVEAGNTDEPVIIIFKSDDASKTITIRDYGTGLSPEEFEELYCSIGSSTKRGSNKYTGGFGLGKFSCLACTDTVYITSYYNGMSRMYIMNKSGNNIVTNLVCETPTKERNGLSVQIEVKELTRYMQWLSDLVFFPNLYVKNDIQKGSNYDYYGSKFDYFDNARIQTFNDSKIKRFKHFAVCSERIDKTILLGNVLYPFDKNKIFKDWEDPDFDKINNIWTTFCGMGYVALSFDIGELEITPNREELIYSTKTINAVRSRLKQAEDEIIECLGNALQNTDFDNLMDYCKTLYDVHYFNFFDEKFTSNEENTDIPLNWDTLIYTNKNLTYKGKKLSEIELKTAKSCWQSSLPGVNSRFEYKKFHYINFLSTSSIHPKLILAADTNLTASLKGFISSKYYGKCITILNYRTVDEYVANAAPYSKKDFDVSFAKVFFTDFIASVPVLSSSDEEFIKYKEGIRAAAKSLEKPASKKKVLVTYYEGYRVRTIRYDNLDALIRDMKIFKDEARKKGLYFVTTAQDVNFAATHAAELLNHRYISVTKENYKKLMKLNLPYVKDHMEVFNLKRIRVYAAVYKVANSSFWSVLPSLIKILPNHLAEKADKILTLKYKSKEFEYIFEREDCRAALANVDSEVYDIVNEIIPYYNIYSDLLKESGRLHSESHFYLMSWIIMKQKLFRLNFKAYEKLKNNNFIKLLEKCVK